MMGTPFFIFFLVFGRGEVAALWHMEFPGQRSDPSHNFDPSHSGGTVRSLTHRARPGIEPASQGSQDTANPVVSQLELPNTDP